jgi:hypothetical protein
MSLYDKASLIQVPSLYKDGTLVSTVPEDRSGDFTFSRGSDISATRVNADGYIEKGYENLLLQSNSFTTSPWQLPIGTDITPNHPGYDGTNDAWLLSKTDSNKYLFQGVSSGLRTFSIYAKAGDSDFVYVRFLTANERVTFDLQNGIALGLSGSIDAKIEPVSGATGWYRCSLTADFNSSLVRIYPAEGNADASGTSGSVYIQDAMLNQGLVAYPYVETTTAPVAGGILEDMPRLDYSNGSCPSLLLEPSRTNLVYQSEYYGVYAPTRVTLTSNYGISPDGNQNAAAIFNTTELGRHNLNGAYFSVTSGTSYVNSVFAKAGTITKMQLRMFSGGGTSIGFNDGVFDLTNGTATGTGAGIESYGNGWYRCYVIDSPTSSVSNARFNIELLDANGGISYQGSITDYIEVFGSDVTESTYKTSYIPTYGVSQTRLRDDITIPSSADLSIPSDSWTILWDISDESVATGGRWFDDNLQKIQLYPTAPNKSRVYWRGIGQYIASAGGSKIIARYDGTTATEFHDGVNKGSASYSGQLPFDFYTALGAGSGKYIFNKFIIFPTALTDSECVELTTIS